MKMRWFRMRLMDLSQPTRALGMVWAPAAILISITWLVYGLAILFDDKIQYGYLLVRMYPLGSLRTLQVVPPSSFTMPYWTYIKLWHAVRSITIIVLSGAGIISSCLLAWHVTRTRGRRYTEDEMHDAYALGWADAVEKVFSVFGGDAFSFQGKTYHKTDFIGLGLTQSRLPTSDSASESE
jgi:hypothetical protein